MQLQGWQTKEGEKKSLRNGRLIHSALETVYQTIRTKRPKAVRFLEKPMLARIEYEVNKNLVQASSQALAQQIEFEGLRTGIVLTEYLDEWSVDLEREWLDVEGVFDVRFKKWRLRGRIDAIYQHSARIIRPLETKTSSRIKDETLLLKLSFDFQSQVYTTASALRLPPELAKHLKGPLYNIVRTPGQRQKQKESQEDLLERIREDIQNRREHYFHRFELNFDEETRQEHYKELAEKLHELEMWLNGGLATFKREDACEGIYGICEFMNLCAGGGSKVGYKKTRVLFRELVEEKSNVGKKGSAKRKKKIAKVRQKKSDPEDGKREGEWHRT